MNEYPSRLLPINSFKIISQDEIDLSETLIRRIDNVKRLSDENGLINPDVIEEKRLFGYSLNKVPPSRFEDIKIKVIEPDSQIKYQVGNNPPKINDIKFCIIDCGAIKFKIGDIHCFIGEYPKNTGRGNDGLEIKKFKIFIEHEPLLVNYSHCEMNVYAEDKKLLNYDKSRIWQQAIIHNIRSIILRISKVVQFGSE
jgi:hypothetical protein